MTKSINLAQKEAKELQTKLNQAVNSGAIKKYSETWWDMTIAINEAKKSVYEYQEALLEAIETHRDLVDSRLESSQEFQRNRGNYKAERNYLAINEIANINSRISELRTAIAYNISKDGAKFIGSDGYLEQVGKLSEAFNMLSDKYKDLIEFDKEHYETLIDMNDALSDNTSNAYENAEAFGEYESMWKYNNEISFLYNAKGLKEQELKTMVNDLNAAVKSGAIKQGSTGWLEQMIAIQKVRNEIQGYDTDMEKAYQKMLEVQYAEMFDRVIEKMDKFIDKLDTINDLLTDEMMYDYDTGKLTESGALAIVLNNNALDVGIEKLQEYVKKRQTIIQDYNAGKYGQETFDKNLAEVEANINSTLNEVNDSRNKILDIIKNQTKAELDVINKVIDARKEAIQKQRDYWTYGNQLDDKNKEIQLLQQQIESLNGVSKYFALSILIAGKPLEPCKLQHKHEIWLSANV